MPYRLLAAPEPEPLDPAIGEYERRVAAARRRSCRLVVCAGLLVLVTAGIAVAVHAARARRLTARWREAMTCLDYSSEGGLPHIREQQVAAINDRSDWPARCSEPLRALARAAREAEHKPLGYSADALAEQAASADVENVDLVLPAWTMIDDGARIGLGPPPPASRTVAKRRTPLLSDLSSSSFPRRWVAADTSGTTSCLVADDGRSMRCGVPWRHFAWSVWSSIRLHSRSDEQEATGDPQGVEAASFQRWSRLEAVQPRLLRRGGALGALMVRACGDPLCPEEPSGVGDGPIAISVGRVGSKIAVVWAESGPVGGVRMRIAETGGLERARSRVVIDDREPSREEGGVTYASESSRIRADGIRLIGRGDHALLFLSALPEDAIFALRLDENGELSPIAVSFEATP